MLLLLAAGLGAGTPSSAARSQVWMCALGSLIWQTVDREGWVKHSGNL